MSVESQADVVAVEWALVAHPDVVEAVASTLVREGGEEFIRAWVVLQPGVEDDPGEAQRLAAYAIESAGHNLAIEVRFVAELPKTRTGKVARWLLEPPTG